MGDFAADFSFDLGDEGPVALHPWEFSSALKDALEPHHASTSVESKIARQRAAKAEADAEASGSDAEDASSGDEGSDDDSDDSDAPLPGEDVSDDDDEEEGEEEEEEESENEAPRAAGGDSDEDSDEEDSDEEEDDDAGVEIDLLGDGGDAKEETSAAGGNKGAERGSDGDEDEDEDEGEEGGSSGGRGSSSRASNGASSSASASPYSFSPAPTATTFRAGSFADLGLSRPLARACAELGYSRPTPIQAACIPLALAGRDVCGSAVTGSGKTAAFSLPILERLLKRDRRVAATRALVLTPARELAVQVHGMIQQLARHTDVRVALAVGGLSLEAQAAALRARPEVLVGTPGRVIDHARNSRSFGLEDLEWLVLDEADRLLDMGFSAEVQEIVRLAPRGRQTLLFSATMTEEVGRLAALSLKRPVRLAADAPTAAPSKLRQEVVRLRGRLAASREAAALALAARTLADGHVIVFTRTKQSAHRLRLLFGLLGLPEAAELHGNMSQAARLEALERFRTGEAKFLMATDVAARGLDVVGVRAVLNADAPKSLDTYLHRVGRTARAGAAGLAITLASDEDRALLKAIAKAASDAAARGRKAGHKGGRDAAPQLTLLRREIPQAAVEKWQARIDGVEDDLRAVLREEAEERMIRQSEMQATRATNMLEHQDEIRARPARTWFQTGREKKATAEAAKKAAEGAATGAAGKAKSAAERASERLARKEQRAKEVQKEKRKRNAPMDETADSKRAAKGIKARAREIGSSGISSHTAAKLAAREAMGAGPKRKKARGLFQGDGVARAGGGGGGGAARVYAGGAKTREAKAPKKGLAGLDLHKAQRHGKGKHAFKSKARHKRR